MGYESYQTASKQWFTSLLCSF